VDTASHIGFRSLGRGTIAGFFITLLVHGAIGYLVYLSQLKAAPPREVVRDFMVTKTVTLGKPREKFWLPKKVQPPPPKIEQPVIKVAQDPNAAPAQKEAPKPEDAEISKDLRRALQRARALAAAAEEEPPEGSLTGSTAGNATEGSAGDEYATQIYEAIKRNWSAPTGLVKDSELAGLVTSIRVRISDDGTLLEPVMQKSSRNQFFDDSCMQAIKATGKVPAPPTPALRAQYRRGVLLEFEGSDLAR
jgi:outer membrane biosynthesis protein TonB